MKFKYRSIYAALATCGIAFSAPEANAYLGSFETDDGYWIGGNGPNTGFQNDIPDGGFGEDYNGNGIVRPSRVWVGATSGDGNHGPDVSRYNAGQFGTNAGGPGGVATDIVDNSGLWRQIQGGREVADTSTSNISPDNLNYVSVISGGGPQYLDIISMTGDLEYAYSLEARDMGTATWAEGVYSMAYLWCPYTSSAADIDTWLSFVDSSGTSGLRLGAGHHIAGVYTSEIFIQDSTGIVDTGMLANEQRFAQVNLSIDTRANTYELNLSDLLDDATYSRTGTLQADILDISDLNFWQRQGTPKNYYDDFSFTFTPIPEPSQVFLLSLGGAVLALRRGRERKPHSGHTIERHPTLSAHPTPPAKPSGGSGCPGADNS